MSFDFDNYDTNRTGVYLARAEEPAPNTLYAPDNTPLNTVACYTPKIQKVVSDRLHTLINSAWFYDHFVTPGIFQGEGEVVLTDHSVIYIHAGEATEVEADDQHIHGFLREALHKINCLYSTSIQKKSSLQAPSHHPIRKRLNISRNLRHTHNPVAGVAREVAPLREKLDQEIQAEYDSLLVISTLISKGPPFSQDIRADLHHSLERQENLRLIIEQHFPQDRALQRAVQRLDASARELLELYIRATNPSARAAIRPSTTTSVASQASAPHADVATGPEAIRYAPPRHQEAAAQTPPAPQHVNAQTGTDAPPARPTRSDATQTTDEAEERHHRPEFPPLCAPPRPPEAIDGATQADLEDPLLIHEKQLNAYLQEDLALMHQRLARMQYQHSIDMLEAQKRAAIEAAEAAARSCMRVPRVAQGTSTDAPKIPATTSTQTSEPPSPSPTPEPDTTAVSVARDPLPSLEEQLSTILARAQETKIKELLLRTQDLGDLLELLNYYKTQPLGQQPQSAASLSGVPQRQVGAIGAPARQLDSRLAAEDLKPPEYYKNKLADIRSTHGFYQGEKKAQAARGTTTLMSAIHSLGKDLSDEQAIPTFVSKLHIRDCMLLLGLFATQNALLHNITAHISRLSDLTSDEQRELAALAARPSVTEGRVAQQKLKILNERIQRCQLTRNTDEVSNLTPQLEPLQKIINTSKKQGDELREQELARAGQKPFLIAEQGAIQASVQSLQALIGGLHALVNKAVSAAAAQSAPGTPVAASVRRLPQRHQK